MEIVLEDKSCYCFRKSASHLPGSFTSFWRAYLKMKTGLKYCFLLSFFILCIYSSSDEECFQSCGVWYSVQSNKILLGLLQNLEMGHPTQKSLTHTGSCRELRTTTIALPRLILFQVCQISSNQLFLGVVLSFLLLRWFICALGAAVIAGGKVLPSLDTFGPISAVWSVHSSCVTCSYTLSILGSMAIM